MYMGSGSGLEGTAVAIPVFGTDLSVCRSVCRSVCLSLCLSLSFMHLWLYQLLIASDVTDVSVVLITI